MLHHTIALLLPRTIQHQLASRLCFGLPQAVWTEPDSLHLIIRQLGPLTHPQLNDIKEALESIYFNAFEVEFKGVEYVAQNRFQGSLLLGIKENEKMKLFIKEIKSHIKDLKIPVNKQEPHLLLGTCLPQKVGDYLMHNSLFTSSSGEMTACGLFSIHLTPKKIFLNEESHYSAAPFNSGHD